VGIASGTQPAPPAHLNTTWYLDLNDIARHSSWAHGFMSAYALYGGLLALALLTVLGWWLARSRPEAPATVAAVVWAGGAVVIALGLNQIVSHAVAEARPYAVLPGVEVLVAKAHDFSFPSDHATMAGAFIVGLFLFDRRYGLVALLLGLLLGFSRVYVGAHYPGDVVAGFLLGGAVAGLGYLAIVPPLRGLTSRLATTPLRLLVQSAPAPAPRPEP